MLNRTEIAQKVIVQMNGKKIYGRITNLLGSQIGELHSIVEVTTPAGSTIKTGIYYLDEVTKPEDIEKFKYFEENPHVDPNSTDPIYYNRLSKEQMKSVDAKETKNRLLDNHANQLEF